MTDVKEIQTFEEAADAVKTLTEKPTDQEMLKLYALYKQGTVGDVNTDRPGMLDFKGKAKWDAWKEKNGVTQDDAKKEYIAFAKQLLDKYPKKE